MHKHIINKSYFSSAIKECVHAVTHTHYCQLKRTKLSALLNAAPARSVTVLVKKHIMQRADMTASPVKSMDFPMIHAIEYIEVHYIKNQDQWHSNILYTGFSGFIIKN